MQREKMLVPTYRMSQSELYLLLRIRMEKTGRKNINGVKKEFFEPETYKAGDKFIKSLAKKKLLEQQGENIWIGEGIERALDTALKSAHCMCFQNDMLQRKGKILSFYYAEGYYAAMLQDKKESMLVCTQDREAVYMAFEGILEAKGISGAFQAEKWEKLHGEPLGKPVREALIMHSRNRVGRNRLTLAMLADKRRLYLMMGEDGQRQEELPRDTQALNCWFGVVMRELGRLKDEGDRLEGIEPEAKKEPAPKSEYQRVVETEGFPRTGIGFWFWCLKKAVMGIPQALKAAAKKKFLSFILYLVWAAALFLYNMYAACYINDTFMFDRRARWGNLTPYLIAGTLSTPSSLKGLGENWGQIDTVFLVWPMMMLLTLIGRHLILQVKSRKFAFLGDVACIPRAVGECRQHGYGRGRQLWIPLLVTWILGFAVMNPVTIFFAAAYCLLVFAQKDNALVRFIMLWRCAADRKGVEAGRRQEPRAEKYRLLFFHMGCGFLIYGLISLALWHVVAYHFWIRLIVTMLMAIFALLQSFWPGGLANPQARRAAGTFLIALIGGMAAAYFSSRYGIVLADDGGWTESGDLAGLLQNAGFSTILGITGTTIALALGAPAVLTGLVAALAALGVFGIGCMDNKAGDYIRKTSRQYFFGPDPGEKKTLLCTWTEIASFIAGFLNPSARVGEEAIRTAKLFQRGKLIGDAVSTLGDIAATGKDIENYAAGEGGIGDLFGDVLGLSLDICGSWDDIVDTREILKDIKIQGKDFKLDPPSSWIKRHEQLCADQEKKINEIRADAVDRQKAATDPITEEFSKKEAEIKETMQKIKNGEATPPSALDRETYMKALDDTLNGELRWSRDEIEKIKDAIREESKKLEDAATKDFRKEKHELLMELFGNLNDTIGFGEKMDDSLGNPLDILKIPEDDVSKTIAGNIDDALRDYLNKEL